MLAFGVVMVWGQAVVRTILLQPLTALLDSIGGVGDAAQITELIGRILTATSPIGITLFSLGAALTILSTIGYCGACCNYRILLRIVSALYFFLILNTPLRVQFICSVNTCTIIFC
ncbi:uncharacterized protein DEA37_0015011 [Paragonimus westermani]|uniref:Uncharacterized protein n=1 Tax=Paragonimus westermani TaxID=34504 RepID=A0A5J4N3T1_9TREM|nr:uncharacterized protein DEA37_0015011 [Paragonimus westermani]